MRGGAVRIAARPYRVATTDGVPVRELDKGVSGVVGVRALGTGYDRETDLLVDAGVTARDWRRGVLALVERVERAELVRVRLDTGGVKPRGTVGESS